VNRDGTDYPVIVIPEGVTAPVAATRDLKDTSGAYLLRQGASIFGRLTPMGRPALRRRVQAIGENS
jgi:hypothetical protein